MCLRAFRAREGVRLLTGSEAGFLDVWDLRFFFLFFLFTRGGERKGCVCRKYSIGGCDCFCFISFVFVLGTIHVIDCPCPFLLSCTRILFDFFSFASKLP